MSPSRQEDLPFAPDPRVGWLPRWRTKRHPVEEIDLPCLRPGNVAVDPEVAEGLMRAPVARPAGVPIPGALPPLVSVADAPSAETVLRPLLPALRGRGILRMQPEEDEG